MGCTFEHEQEASTGMSWIPYTLFSRIMENKDDTLYIDMSDYGIDKRFWLKLPPSDEGLSRQLRTFGFREPLNCKCYVKFIDQHDTLLDIGANIGFFTLLGGDAKRIVCVEPLSDAISMLRENIELNDLSSKCEIVQAAVGPNGRLHMEVKHQMNLSKVVNEKNDNTIDVDSIRLHDLVDRYSPNMIRLDVEGFESDILLGQVPDSIDKISMEFHSELMGKEKAKRLIGYFKEEGFRVKYFVEDLPLRFYPLLRILKNTDIFKPLCYVWSNLEIDDITGRVFSGRALKYLYLVR